MTTVAGRHAVVTGASRGIGVHVARALVAAGAHVTIAARSAKDLEAVRASLGGRTVAVTADVTSDSDRASLIAAAEEALGPIDILVNNAGVEWASAFAVQGIAEIEETMAINLLAPMRLTRDVLPGMLSRRRGHIVNMASGAGKSGTPFEAAYSASKFGLVGFSHALRAELAGTGVSCSVICPGFVADDGMYPRFEADGLVAPRILGVSPMAKVTAAVLSSIEKDRPEVLVNPTPLRPVLALEALAPRVHGWVMEVFGVTRLFGGAAERRGSA